MILLDTDHLSMLKYPNTTRCAALTQRLSASPDQKIGTTIVSIEEQWRGWLAVIARNREIRRQLKAYRELADLLDFLSQWNVVPLDEKAVERFEALRAAGNRIGSMDLKIASIALANDALVLSANMTDFRQVPGLRVENWLD